MAIKKVNNMIMMQESPDEMINVDEMMLQGVGSVFDLRLKLPQDYLQRERMGMSKAEMYYMLAPMDRASAGPINMVESMCRMMMDDMMYGKSVAVVQNTDQQVAPFVCGMMLTKIGFTPQSALGMIGDPKQMTDMQKNVMNAYAEQTMKMMFVKNVDPMQKHLMMQQAIDEVMKKSSGHTEAQLTYTRQYDFRLTRNLLNPCSCGDK